MTHRSLASILTGLTTYHMIKLLRTTALPLQAKMSIYFLLFALWMQLSIGVNVIWQNVPIELASSH